MNNLIELYCAVDDFMKIFWVNWSKKLIAGGERKRIKPSALSPSEVMTIMILFHQSNYGSVAKKLYFCILNEFFLLINQINRNIYVNF